MNYYTKETKLPSYVPVPRFMIQGEYSINAKLLYGLLLSRTQLSQKSGWVNENCAVYVIYSVRQMAEDLNRSERTVNSALNELEGAGLIERVRQGWNKPNLLYLLFPADVKLLAYPDPQESAPPEGKICGLDTQESALSITQNLPPNKNKRITRNSYRTEGQGPPPLGKYGNVVLSAEEQSRLQTTYPAEYAEYIERLSEYMQSSGKQYADHAATIESWIRRDRKSAPGKSYDYTASYEEGECL